MREQEAGLVLRSLYGSDHPQGDTVQCPDTLKLATSLEDGCLSAPSISSAAYIFILNLAELSLPLSLSLSLSPSLSECLVWWHNRRDRHRTDRERGRERERGGGDKNKASEIKVTNKLARYCYCTQTGEKKQNKTGSGPFGPHFELQMLHARQK